MSFLLHFKLTNTRCYPLQVRCQAVIEVLHRLLLIAMQCDLITSCRQGWRGQRSGDAGAKAPSAAIMLSTERQRGPWTPQSVHDQSTRGTQARWPDHTPSGERLTTATDRHGWVRRSMEVSMSFNDETKHLN